MLSKKNRLKINNRTTAAWDNKKEVFTSIFKLVYHLRDEAEDKRIGFIVTGKAGIAVKRNRIRRVFSEVIREKIGEFPKGFEGVFIFSKKIQSPSYEEAEGFLNRVLSRLRKGNEN